MATIEILGNATASDLSTLIPQIGPVNFKLARERTTEDGRTITEWDNEAATPGFQNSVVISTRKVASKGRPDYIEWSLTHHSSVVLSVDGDVVARHPTSVAITGRIPLVGQTVAEVLKQVLVVCGMLYTAAPSGIADSTAIRGMMFNRSREWFGS